MVNFLFDPTKSGSATCTPVLQLVDSCNGDKIVVSRNKVQMAQSLQGYATVNDFEIKFYAQGSSRLWSGGRIAFWKQQSTEKPNEKGLVHAVYHPVSLETQVILADGTKIAFEKLSEEEKTLAIAALIYGANQLAAQSHYLDSPIIEGASSLAARFAPQFLLCLPQQTVCI